MKDFIQKQINKISVKVLLLTIAPVLVILALATAFCARSISKNAIELAYQQLISKSISDGSSFESFLSQNIASISIQSHNYALESYLAALSSDSPSQTEHYRSQIVEFLDDLFDAGQKSILSAWVMDYHTSAIISNTEAAQFLPDSCPTFSGRPWYRQLLSAQNAYVTDVYLSPYGEFPVVSIVAPVRNSQNHQVLGAIGASYRLNSLGEAILPSESAERSPGLCTFILDANNTIVASHPEQYAGASLMDDDFHNVSIEDTLSSIGRIYSFELEDIKMVGAISNLNTQGWKALTMAPQSAIKGRAQTFTKGMGLILAVGCLSLIFSMGLVSIVISRPIKKITEAAKEIAKGNYSVQLEASSNDEIGELARAVNSSIAALRHQSIYDPLTKIYNSQQVISESQQMMEANPDKTYAIIRMDIANFKMVNDFFGNDMGDELLKFIARVLIDQATGTSCFGRINRDIFCICREYTTKDDLLFFLEKLTLHVKAFPIHFSLIPYFGVVINTYPQVSVDILLDWANLALKTVKGNSLLNYAFYDSYMREMLVERDTMEREMHKALKNREFQVYLQPKCDISTSQVVGAEALVRWVHPAKGMISPNVFIPLFEKNGFVTRLDEYIWEETCKLIKGWLDKGYSILPISVNVSRTHIYDPDFTNKLTSLVDRYQIPVHTLELEFTESAFINDVAQLYSTMSYLQEKGFVLSMDDFGSGYSSLNMLKNGPMDIVKIDQGFLNETLANSSGKIIVRNIISMINQLQKRIVAEGVETEEQASFLLSAGCSIAQGYYYSRPILPEEFECFAFKRNAALKNKE